MPISDANTRARGKARLQAEPHAAGTDSFIAGEFVEPSGRAAKN